MIRQAASVRPQPHVQVSAFSCLSAAAFAAGDSLSRSTPGIFVACAAFLIIALVSSSTCSTVASTSRPASNRVSALGRRGVQHPDVFLDDLRVAIDDERRRQRVDAGEDLLELRRRHDDRVVHVLLGGELAHDVGSDLVLRDADDLKLVAILLLQRDQVGDLRAARRAPGRPEVDDRDLAAQRIARNRPTVEVAHAERGHGGGVLRSRTVSFSPVDAGAVCGPDRRLA